MTVEDKVPVVPPSDEMAWKHYDQLVGTYRHHFDLGLKCIAIFLAVVGTSTGLIFSQNPDPVRSKALAIFVALISAMCNLGSLSGFAWLNRVERQIAPYERQLHLSRFSLSAFRTIVWLFFGLTILILAGSIATAIGAI